MDLPYKSGAEYTSLSLTLTIMSQSILTGYIPLPGQPPGISSKTSLVSRDVTFESCPRAGNLTRTRVLWKMKVKLQKNSVDQFLQVKTKTS